MHTLHVSTHAAALGRCLATESETFHGYKITEFFQQSSIDLVRTRRTAGSESAKKNIRSNLFGNLLMVGHPEGQGINPVTVLVVDPAKLFCLAFQASNQNTYATDCQETACH